MMFSVLVFPYIKVDYSLVIVLATAMFSNLFIDIILAVYGTLFIPAISLLYPPHPPLIAFICIALFPYEYFRRICLVCKWQFHVNCHWPVRGGWSGGRGHAPSWNLHTFAQNVSGNDFTAFRNVSKWVTVQSKGIVPKLIKSPCCLNIIIAMPLVK